MIPQRTVQVSVFDRSREYDVIVHRGSPERENQFDKGEWRDLLFPILKMYIREKEHTRFDAVMDNMGYIDGAESN